MNARQQGQPHTIERCRLNAAAGRWRCHRRPAIIPALPPPSRPQVNAGQSIDLINCFAGYQRRSTWGTLDQDDTMASGERGDQGEEFLRRGRAARCPCGDRAAVGLHTASLFCAPTVG